MVTTNTGVSGNLIIPSTVSYGSHTYRVTSIEDYAFWGCDELTSVVIPGSIWGIGGGAFDGCSELASVTFGHGVSTIGTLAFRNCTSLDSVVIPSSVTELDAEAFMGCTGLHIITLPNSISSISQGIFEDCNNLNTITIPNSVTGIGENAFRNCYRLSHVDIPNSVTEIGENAFYGCSGLSGLDIPSSVATIGTNAFYGVRRVNYFGSASGSPWGALYHYGYAEWPFYYADATKTTLVGCDTSVTTLTIPNTVTTIADSAFLQNTRLTSVIIPNSVRTIGKSAFEGCSGLGSITIGNSVESVGDWAFDNCSGLSWVNYTGTIAGWCNIDFGLGSRSNPVYYAHELYIDSVLLTDLVVPSTVTAIQPNTFIGCNSLTSVTIGDSVTAIGMSAFSGCIYLRSLVLGRSVTSIGWGAFSLCYYLNSITSHANTAPSLYNNSFYHVSNSAQIIVPCGSSASYQSGWSQFSNITETMLDSYSLDVESEDESQGVAEVTALPTCTTPAVVTATASSCYIFDHWSDGSTENPYSLSLTQDTLLTAYFTPEIYRIVYVHDTVVVHDTVYVTLLLRDSTIVYRGGDTITIHDTVRDCHNQQLVLIVNNDTLGACSGAGSFPYGSTVQIMAIPAQGTRFLRWSDGNTENPRTVMLNGSLTFTAIFEQEE